MPTTTHRRSTAEIVNAIKAAVSAVKLPDGQWGSSLPDLTNAFDRVELFDAAELTEAFRYLLITEQRVCVIVPLDEQLESVIEKQKLVVKRMLPVAILVSDRVLGNRSAALWGDDDRSPGANALVDLVLPAVTGLLLPNPAGVLAEPANIQVMSVKDTEKNLPSRVCMELEMHCRGGYLQSALPPGPIF